MMKNSDFAIIVVGHGNFATGISSALELIMGKQEDYVAIDYNEDMDKNKFKDILIKNIDSKNNKDILLLCDLMNGTPFNIALELSFEYENINIIYGLNLGMLIEIVSSRLFSKEYNINKLVDIGKKSIGYFNKLDFEN